METDYNRATSAERMNKTFYYFPEYAKKQHANHMIGRTDDIQHEANGLVLVWLGKRGCPMVVNRKTLQLTYYQTYQEALDAILDKYRQPNGEQMQLF